MVLSMLCCAGCEQPILDRFLYNVLDRAWHAACVRCADCQCTLSEKCFSREGKIFCREDFFRRFGTKCCGCSQGISPNDLVRRARDKVFHLKCFTCVVCRKQLSTGEQLYVVGETTFVCKDDYLKQMNDYSFFSSEDEDEDSFQDKLILDEAVTSPALRPPSIGSTNSPSVDTKPPVGADCYVSGAESVTSVDSEVKDNQSESKPKIDSDSKGDKASGDCDVLDEGHGNGKRRGPRTTIKAKQLEILKSAFAATPKPTRHIREQLAKETGLNMRVIQVWFQNKRSKERRMKQLSSLNARRSFFRQVGGPRRMRPLQPGMCDIEEGSGFPYFPDGGPPGDFGYGNQPYYEFFPNSRGGDMFPPPQGGPVPLEPPHGGPMYHPMGTEAPFMPPNDIPSRSSPEMQGMTRRTGGGDGGPFPPHNPNMMRETAVW